MAIDYDKIRKILIHWFTHVVHKFVNGESSYQSRL